VRVRPARAETVTSAVPDVLARHLRVVFCGINPGRASAMAAAHFANPRNDFWRLLHAADFTTRPLQPADQLAALEFGVGLTNAALRTTRGSADLRRADFMGAADRLERLAQELEPAWIAFVGKEAYRGAFGERTDFGLQTRTLAETRLFVLPSTSPANAAVPWNERLRWFRALARASQPVPRPGVRALLLDRENRLFLHRFVTSDDPGVWVAPGGAVDGPEDREAALRRELNEELQLDDIGVGPWIWRRRHIWNWPARGEIYDTHEEFALVRVTDPAVVRPTAHDSLFAGPRAREQHRWWTAPEISRSGDTFSPRQLGRLLAELVAVGPPAEPIDTGI
jgi:TDG/mug DNA glycosylase family protein